MGQGEFDWTEPGEEAGKEGPRTLEERFAEWIEGHGAAVYESFCEIARQVKATGRERFGGKALAEVARWKRAIEGKDTEGYKVNNNYVSLMVRRLIDEEPEFADWFELRRLRSERESNGAR